MTVLVAWIFIIIFGLTCPEVGLAVGKDGARPPCFTSVIPVPLEMVFQMRQHLREFHDQTVAATAWQDVIEYHKGHPEKQRRVALQIQEFKNSAALQLAALREIEKYYGIKIDFKTGLYEKTSEDSTKAGQSDTVPINSEYYPIYREYLVLIQKLNQRAQDRLAKAQSDPSSMNTVEADLGLIAMEQKKVWRALEDSLEINNLEMIGSDPDHFELRMVVISLPADVDAPSYIPPHLVKTVIRGLKIIKKLRSLPLLKSQADEKAHLEDLINFYHKQISAIEDSYLTDIEIEEDGRVVFYRREEFPRNLPEGISLADAINVENRLGKIRALQSEKANKTEVKEQAFVNELIGVHEAMIGIFVEKYGYTPSLNTEGRLVLTQ